MTHSEKWLYRLDHPVTWRSGHLFPHDMAFNDLTGTRRLEITRSRTAGGASVPAPFGRPTK